MDEARACFERERGDGETSPPLAEFLDTIDALHETLAPFLETRPKAGPHAEVLAELNEARRRFAESVEQFESRAGDAKAAWAPPDPGTDLHGLVQRFAPLAEDGRTLVTQTDRLSQLVARLIETCEREGDARSSDAWNPRDVTRARKAVDTARGNLTKQDAPSVSAWGRLAKVHYFWSQAHWLTERFPTAELRDIPGLVKLVDRAEIEANDWSLTPGRYVGVAPEAEDENFDFAATLRALHAELDGLDAEAVKLAAKIKENFEKLGI